MTTNTTTNYPVGTIDACATCAGRGCACANYASALHRRNSTDAGPRDDRPWPTPEAYGL